MLTQFFQSLLDRGELPKEWKDALIFPIYKKNDRNSAFNYRPVSLTYIIFMILEPISHSSVMKHFDEHQILTDKQYGFRQRRSCETQLIATIEGTASQLSSGEVDIMLLEFSKAFDKVPYQHLLYKLGYCGVHGWIKSFLNDRSQQVILEGRTSSEKKVLSGVSKGTIPCIYK